MGVVWKHIDFVTSPSVISQIADYILWQCGGFLVFWKMFVTFRLSRVGWFIWNMIEMLWLLWCFFFLFLVFPKLSNNAGQTAVLFKTHCPLRTKTKTEQKCEKRIFKFKYMLMLDRERIAWWHCWCIFSPFSVAFHALPHPFHSIPADVWWMLWQNVHTEHYWFLTSSLKRPGSLIGQVGSMFHLSTFRLPQMSRIMWSRHLRKLCALITGTEEWGQCPTNCSYRTSCCNETDMLISNIVAR